MTGSESKARPRKRSRTSEDADDAAVASGSKKVRGRPRVDTQDATAAEVSITLPIIHHFTLTILRVIIQLLHNQGSHTRKTDAVVETKNTDPSCTTCISAA